MNNRSCTDPLAVPKCKRQKLIQNSHKFCAPARESSSEMPLDLAVPKCVSMWKNKKGYLVPIHTRLCTGAHNYITVNTDKFREFNEALDRAEEMFNNSK
eukprot:jgi/Antlo1/544/293